MALIYADRVQETTTTTGTGTMTLAGAATGYQSFAAIGNGNTCVYALEDANGTGWEVGIGTYTSSGTTLARTTILASSNSGSAITLSSGTHKVYVTADASALQQTQLRIKPETVTTGNITGEVGTQHVCTIAGLTAHRDFVLPAVCAVGDRVSVISVDGDDTYALLIKPATGDTINGGTAGAEWSRLFMAGEVVTLRCVTANSAWIVEKDGRIPTGAQIAEQSASPTSLSHATFTKIGLDTTKINVGGLADLGNARINIRRSGNYLVVGLINISDLAVNSRTICRIYKNGANTVELQRGAVVFAGTGTASGTVEMACVAADYLELYGYWNIVSGSGSKSVDIADAAGCPYLSVSELL